MGCPNGSKRPFLPYDGSRVRCSPAACISLGLLVVVVLIFELGPFSSIHWPPLVYHPPSKGYDSSDEVMTSKIYQLNERIEDLDKKLHDSVTFSPLIVMRQENTELWFMSKFGKEFEDPNGFMYFPSKVSKERMLCVTGKNQTDGTQNGYALAWRDYLPPTSILIPGLTFLSESYYSYQKLWDCLEAMGSFLLLSKRNQYTKPDRFVLYRKGELVHEIPSWISMVLLSTLGYEVPIERLDYRDRPVCFERSVVNRHGFNLFPLKVRSEILDIIRQKGRRFCNVKKIDGLPTFNFTLLTRTGKRSFKNVSEVSSTFKNECKKVRGCRFRSVRIDGLSFCDQVSLMTTTQVLASVHGEQLTNMVFMDKGRHIMEMYPKGWVELAAPGKYIYQSLAHRAGLKHEGSWHDSEGPDCPHPEKGSLYCFSFYKDRQVGFNRTELSMWAAEALQKVEVSKAAVNSKLVQNGRTD